MNISALNMYVFLSLNLLQTKILKQCTICFSIIISLCVRLRVSRRSDLCLRISRVKFYGGRLTLFINMNATNNLRYPDTKPGMSVDDFK